VDIDVHDMFRSTDENSLNSPFVRPLRSDGAMDAFHLDRVAF